MHDSVAERRGGDGALLGVEDLEGERASRDVASCFELALERKQLWLQPLAEAGAARRAAAIKFSNETILSQR